MSDIQNPICPECEGTFELPESQLGRRDFIRVAGAGIAALSTGGLILPATARAARADAPPTAPKKPAEDLIIELYKSLTAEQKAKVVKSYDHGADKGRPTRLSLNPNRALFGPEFTVGKIYTKAQQEILDKILMAISSGEDGYRRITRNGTFDASKSIQNCGADLFGDPTTGKYAFIFTGHHLTVRSDGDFTDGVAFGGPIYYGHSPNGYSRANIFYYQTKSVTSVFEALSEAQRAKATVKMGNPGEGDRSVRFKAQATERPGLPLAELSKAQKDLVEKVMRDVLSPFRKEDAEEVLTVIKKNGGMDKIQLAFYSEDYEGARTSEKEPWSFWRLEGPGFVWNYRVLPHVHTYVNISNKTS